MDDDTVKHDVVWTASVIRVVGEKYESMTNRRLKSQAQLGQIIDGTPTFKRITVLCHPSIQIAVNLRIRMTRATIHCKPFLRV